MKLRYWIIAGAACALAPMAMAQQQPGTPGQEQQSPGVTDQGSAGQQPGATEQERAGQGGMPGAMDQERAGEQPGAMEQERAGQPGALDQERARHPGATEQESGAAQRGAMPGGGMDQERGAMQRGMTGQERAGRGQMGGQMAQNQQVVRQVQQKLKQEGYQVGPVDGIWGPKTQSAVREFQQAEGLEPTGQLNRQTLAALEIQGGSAAAGGEAGEPGAGTAAGAAGQEQQQDQPQQSPQSPLESPGQQPQQSQQ